MGWSDEDRDKAIAYNAWKGSLCSKCGTDPNDWIDEEGYPDEPGPFHAVSQVCYGCATLEDERNLVPKDKVHSTNVYLQRWTRREAAEWLRKQSQ